MAEIPAARTRILIVDDHALFREGVARLLSTELDFEIAGLSGSVEEALAVMSRERVDIVLLDFDLGRQTGGDFLRAAVSRGFRGNVLVVTAGVDAREAAELIQTGIAGIFMKHDSAAKLADGIRDVLKGRVWFDQEVLQRAARAGEHTRVPGRGQRFTAREHQVLSYVFEGLANKEIAGRIGVSESSVKATLQQLFGKTGVRTRSQLVRIALEQHRDEL
jgi:DNA-binding NarL/FixJ family response regulator